MAEGTYHLGYTGTRHGMTVPQCEAVEGLIRRLSTTRFLIGHHGDCIGGDAQFHGLCQKLGVQLIGHPPTDEKHRAFCKGWLECRAPMPYLQRDRAMVGEVSWLIAAPREIEHQTRGGTWYTHDHALTRLIPVARVRPDGLVTYPGLEWPR